MLSSFPSFGGIRKNRKEKKKKENKKRGFKGVHPETAQKIDFFEKGKRNMNVPKKQILGSREQKKEQEQQRGKEKRKKEKIKKKKRAYEKKKTLNFLNPPPDEKAGREGGKRIK